MSAEMQGREKINTGLKNMKQEIDSKYDSFELDADLKAALGDFRSSVHAWSDAAYSRPRAVAAASHGVLWRKVTGWAVGCVLVLGVAGGATYQHERYKKAQREADVRRMEQMRQTAAEDALLAHVDRDVSRQVPAALDQLASLVGEDDSQ